MEGNHALYRVVEVAPWHPAPEMRAFQVPIDPSGGDAIKPLSLPTPVEVREGPDRRPVMVRMGKGWRRVVRVEDTWSFDLWWLPAPITRTYYRVSLEDGRQATLFRDHEGDCWSRQGLLSRCPPCPPDTWNSTPRASTPLERGRPTPMNCWPRQRSTATTALALTDTNLCGALEFARQANSLGIQPITGGEMTLTERLPAHPAGGEPGGVRQHLPALHPGQRP